MNKNYKIIIHHHDETTMKARFDDSVSACFGYKPTHCSAEGAALTVAAAVSGACAFVAPSSSGVSTGRTTPALRGQVKAQDRSNK